ncbi:HypC/HybG/HupF family hydrogenase formation chaperone [Clostridium omnivorum]|uniref:Hydrogenase assembly protein HypC n=1 Tax=Clostridium omnivorum TaxID=1604902 RepID=A0ABQ5NAZ7_9CLOT|nr:HypC/HybG/HupF family hydrogenase formation chaperone [Clostridium sp. E14]GLC32378.1 hydrogenase assembly protein HypC [Clostridium sp. E14]
MCLGIPLRVICINGNTAVGEMNGIERKIRIDLVPNVKLENYVMVHAGFAIEIIDYEAAKETLDIMKELEESLEQNNR